MALKYKRRYGGYGPLKTKKGKGIKKYKSVNNYLNAIYRNNKEYLDQHIKVMGDTRTKREIFKEEVMSRLGKINPDTGKKYTIKQAIERVQRSTLVTTQMERIGETRITRMKEQSPEAFKKLRKEIGWTTKIKSENFIEMTHDGKKNYLRYKDPSTGKDIIIVETISPKSGVATSYDIMDYEEWRVFYVKEHKDESAEMAAEYARLHSAEGIAESLYRTKNRKK